MKLNEKITEKFRMLEYLDKAVLLIVGYPGKKDKAQFAKNKAQEETLHRISAFEK